VLRRRETDNWLAGLCKLELTGSKLPSQREILAVFMNHHKIEHKTVKESAALLAKEVMVFWEKARISTKRNGHVAEKVKKIIFGMGWSKKEQRKQKGKNQQVS